LPSKAVVAGVGVCAAVGTLNALRITKKVRKPRNLIAVFLSWLGRSALGVVSGRF